MSLPASKRRRISQEPSTVDETRQESHQSYPQSAPTTPRRATYLSPTKSSLQRSHPHLLQRLSKVSANSHGQRLLEHVLSGATTGNVEPPQANTNADEVVVDPSPPIQPNGTAHGGATEQLSHPRTRSALQRRRLTAQPVSEELEEQQTQGYSIVPRLVKRSQARRRQFSMSSDENEPALPPTPVQLGLAPAPERPRGLSSSSPRSGSGRNRRRLRSSQDAITSPLKPKSRQSRAHQMAKRDQENHQSEAVSESTPDDAIIEQDDERDDAVPEEIKEKQKILKELQTQTRKLLANTRSLETALAADDVNRTLAKDAGFIDLIKTAGMTRTLQEPLFDLKPAAPAASRQKLHLNLFAPGGLNVATRTSTRVVKEHAKIAHSVKVTAPPPWPPHMFSATFEVITDPEDLKVDRIIYTDARRGEGISNELYLWIKARLASDNLRTDLAGLIWGIGMYFSAAIDRAKVFYSLRRKYGNDHSGHDPTMLSASKPGKTTVDQAVALSPFITDTSITLELPASDSEPSSQPSTRQSTKTSPKLLASWRITLSPTSDPRNTCEILLSGISDEAVQAAAALFDKLCKAQGYERAFDGVWALLVDGPEMAAPAATDGGATVKSGSQRSVDETARAKKKRKRIA